MHQTLAFLSSKIEKFSDRGEAMLHIPQKLTSQCMLLSILTSNHSIQRQK